jgi:phosphatidylinositol-4,5-bisphosphate 3-kinase
MDQMWLDHGLDLRLRPYDVIATGVNSHGQGVGMIMPVMGASTTSKIAMEQAGGSASGAFKDDVFIRYIRNHNPSAESYEKAAENFLLSCAGYLVATFVLGIGDRHNGNIMITERGHLFHIDFGHFLGNFKSKYGVNRERSAFCFTPEMAAVMGGPGSKLFKHFLDVCQQAFHILRQNCYILELLFILMVPAGMPELMVNQDVHYLRDKLELFGGDANAEKVLRQEINLALSAFSRRIDNFFHIYKHKG